MKAKFLEDLSSDDDFPCASCLPASCLPTSCLPVYLRPTTAVRRRNSSPRATVDRRRHDWARNRGAQVSEHKCAQMDMGGLEKQGYWCYCPVNRAAARAARVFARLRLPHPSPCPYSYSMSCNSFLTVSFDTKLITIHRIAHLCFRNSCN